MDTAHGHVHVGLCAPLCFQIQAVSDELQVGPEDEHHVSMFRPTKHIKRVLAPLRPALPPKSARAPGRQWFVARAVLDRT